MRREGVVVHVFASDALASLVASHLGLVTLAVILEAPGPLAMTASMVASFTVSTSQLKIIIIMVRCLSHIFSNLT